jgi:hypothetical protein
MTPKVGTAMQVTDEMAPSAVVERLIDDDLDHLKRPDL